MALFNSKHTNILADGEVAGRSPDAEGDFYQVADAQSDHNYWQEKFADLAIASTTTPTVEFLILTGGVVTDSGSSQVDISECVAVGRDSSGNKRLIHIPALTNVPLPSGWNDGRSIWVTAKYDFKLGALTRAHRAGTSYHYQLEDTYMGDSSGYVSTTTDDLFTTTDPAASAVILGKFTMTGSTFANLNVRSRTLDQDMKDRLYPVGSFYVQYPAAASDSDSVAFPTSARPETMFGGTWALQFNTENVFFRTAGTDYQTRTNGLSLDQFEDHRHSPLSNTSFFGANAAPNNGYTSTGAYIGQFISSTGNSVTDGTNALRTGAVTEPRNRLMKLWKRTVL